MKCDICQCRLYPEDQQFSLVANAELYYVCVMCGRAAEILGHTLVIE